MTEVHSEALGQTVTVDRVIGRIDGANPGPCLVFFGGVHGNEPSGVFALSQVVKELEAKKEQMSGTVIAISGNLWALERAVRFHKADLNRLWTAEKLKALGNGAFVPENEDEKQQKEIFNLIQGIINNEPGPHFFFDLHTTSSPTTPFLTVNDSIVNRKFTRQYPISQILGIEEFLEGPLLSYFNELGYVSFGFEAGQHDDPESVVNARIFAYLSIVFAGVLPKSQVPFDEYVKQWKQLNAGNHQFYEIFSRHCIQSGEEFSMKPGFSNFQKVEKGQPLATSNGTTLSPEKNATLFMPLYQPQGEDGFFLIRKVPQFFLWLSVVLRRVRLDRIIAWLPGVSWATKEKDAMLVNLKIARLVAKQFFHLLGYRSKQRTANTLLVKNREYRSRRRDYQNENWYK